MFIVRIIDYNVLQLQLIVNDPTNPDPPSQAHIHTHTHIHTRIHTHIHTHTRIPTGSDIVRPVKDAPVGPDDAHKVLPPSPLHSVLNHEPIRLFSSSLTTTKQIHNTHINLKVKPSVILY